VSDISSIDEQSYIIYLERQSMIITERHPVIYTLH